MPRSAGSTDDAVAILRGADPSEILRDKRLAFWRNLLAPGDTDEVTVDSWMARALGVKSVTHANYERLADAIRQAARAVGLAPDAFQAAVWCVIRREATA